MPQVGPGFLELCFVCGCGLRKWAGALSRRDHAPPLAWQKLVQLVNEVEDPGRMAGTDWFIVWRWNCSNHAVSGLCGWCGGMSVCVFRCSVLYYWHCLWASCGQSKFLGEWAHQDCAVLGVFWPAQCLVH